MRTQEHFCEQTEDDFFAVDPRADFAHWSRASYWTIEEAIALSLGYDPNVVSSEKLKDYDAAEVPFVAVYAQRRDLILRGKEMQLTDRVVPHDFVAWARARGIPVPPELEERVRAISGTVDWRARYEEAKAQLDEIQRGVRRLSRKR
jgi:hypothetical protein